MRADRVLTVNVYYDGPRLGVAELRGVPHIYEAEFDYSSDEWGDTYFLSPIDPDLLALVLEEWAIWRRWDEAFKAGKVTVDTHPSLTEERERHIQITEEIGDRLRVDANHRLYFEAAFGHVPQDGAWDGMTVEWNPISAS